MHIYMYIHIISCIHSHTLHQALPPKMGSEVGKHACGEAWDNDAADVRLLLRTLRCVVCVCVCVCACARAHEREDVCVIMSA